MESLNYNRLYRNVLLISFTHYFLKEMKHGVMEIQIFIYLPLNISMNQQIMTQYTPESMDLPTSSHVTNHTQ